jgi:hypothetical protein
MRCHVRPYVLSWTHIEKQILGPGLYTRCNCRPNVLSWTYKEKNHGLMVMHFWNMGPGFYTRCKKRAPHELSWTQNKKNISPMVKEFFSLMGPWFYTSITVSCLYDTSCTFMDPHRKSSWPLGQEVFHYWVHDSTLV